MRKYFNRVAFQTSTTGTGSVDVGSAVNDALLTPDEAGAQDADTSIPYLIEDGTDFELGLGTFNAGTPDTFDRDAVAVSKISGTAGTSKIDLSGGATVRFVADAEGLRGTAAPDVILEHREDSGDDGGTATSGSYETRPLNTEVRDLGGICSLSSNQFTLAAGTYYIEADAVFYRTNITKVRIFNDTGTATLVGPGIAVSARGSGDSTTPLAAVSGVFTVAAGQAIELQSRVEASTSNLGFGAPGSFGDDEVYAQVRIWRID